MDSDSDSDDEILLTQTFKLCTEWRPRNRKGWRKNVLEEAMAESERQHVSLVRIHQIQRERATQDDSEDDEIMHARIEQMTLSIKQEGAPKRQEDVLEGFDDVFPRLKRVALQKAMDADLSSRLGTRKGIIQFKARRSDFQVYSTEEEAIQDLHRVLRGCKRPVYESLFKAAEYGMLAHFLASERLVETLKAWMMHSVIGCVVQLAVLESAIWDRWDLLPPRPYSNYAVKLLLLRRFPYNASWPCWNTGSISTS